MPSTSGQAATRVCDPNTPYVERRAAARGILTWATGAPKYLTMAKMLAITLQRTDPDLPRAVITDSDDPELLALFPIVVPYQADWGELFYQKACFDRYTPFDETLYIDADCLVVRSVAPLWDLFSAVPFGVAGRLATSGSWYMDIAACCAELELPALSLFNGGLFYLRRGPELDALFAETRVIMDHYESYNLAPEMRGKSDEPAFSIAMARQGILPCDQNMHSMATPQGLVGKLDVDVLRGRARFQKAAQKVDPAILHFAGTWAKGVEYKRECAKLRWVTERHVPPLVASLLLNLAYSPLIAARDARLALRRRLRPGS